jgi:hypothetical protein
MDNPIIEVRSGDYDEELEMIAPCISIPKEHLEGKGIEKGTVFDLRVGKKAIRLLPTEDEYQEDCRTEDGRYTYLAIYDEHWEHINIESYYLYLMNVVPGDTFELQVTPNQIRLTLVKSHRMDEEEKESDEDVMTPKEPDNQKAISLSSKIKMKVRITTYLNYFNCWYWNEEVKKDASEEEKEYAQMFIDAEDEGEKAEIARDLIEYAQLTETLCGSYFNDIEVEYPNGELPNEDITPDDCVDNNDKDISEYYEEQWEDSSNTAVILKDDQYKRSTWILEIDTDKPFNINYLSVMDGVITYGTHQFEYEDGGEGSYTDYAWRD